MPNPSVPLNGIGTGQWRLAVAAPVQEALLTGDGPFFYVWAATEPAIDSIGGHFVQALVNEPVIANGDEDIWVRAAFGPCNITVTIEPAA